MLLFWMFCSWLFAHWKKLLFVHRLQTTPHSHLQLIFFNKSQSCREKCSFPFHFRDLRCYCSVMSTEPTAFSRLRTTVLFISLELEVLKKSKLWVSLLPDGLTSFVPCTTLSINSFLPSLSLLSGIGDISHLGWKKALLAAQLFSEVECFLF